MIKKTTMEIVAYEGNVCSMEKADSHMRVSTVSGITDCRKVKTLHSFCARNELLDAMRGHILSETRLFGKYKRVH